MKLTKQRLKEMIMNELGMYKHVPDEPVSGDLFGALEEVIEQWAPKTEEGQLYEADILSLLNKFGQLEEQMKSASYLEEDKKFMQKASEETEEEGHEGIFKKWCKDNDHGGVNQTCINAAYKAGAPWKKRAALAVTYSRAKGGQKSLKYPTDDSKKKKTKKKK